MVTRYGQQSYQFLYLCFLSLLFFGSASLFAADLKCSLLMSSFVDVGGSDNDDELCIDTEAVIRHIIGCVQSTAARSNTPYFKAQVIQGIGEIQRDVPKDSKHRNGILNEIVNKIKDDALKGQDSQYALQHVLEQICVFNKSLSENSSKLKIVNCRDQLA